MRATQLDGRRDKAGKSFSRDIPNSLLLLQKMFRELQLSIRFTETSIVTTSTLDLGAARIPQ